MELLETGSRLGTGEKGLFVIIFGHFVPFCGHLSLSVVILCLFGVGLCLFIVVLCHFIIHPWQYHYKCLLLYSPGGGRYSDHLLK